MKLRELLGLKSHLSSTRLSRQSRRKKFAFEMLEERRVLAGWTLGLESTGSSYNESYDVLEAPSGDVYVTGHFFGTVNFNPKGSTAVTLTNASSASDAFLAKYDSAGVLVWARSLSGNSSSVESGRAIVLDGSGNVYISGLFGGSAQFHKEDGTTTGAPLSATGTTNATNVFVAKLTASGDVTSAWTLGNAYLGVSTTGLPAETLAVDSTGYVWLAGTFSGTANFGSISLTAAGTSKNSSPTDIFVTKLDANLSGAQWVGQMGGNSNETGAGLALDSFNNVYITGSFSGTSDFNPGPSVTNVTSSGSSSSNIFLTKLDSLGGFVWAKDLGPGGANQVAIGKSPVGNNVYVDNVVLTAQRTGVGVFDLDPGPGSTNLNTVFAIAQYTINGELNWAIGLTERVRGIDTDSIGNVYASGRFSGMVDFDPGPNQVILTSIGIGDSNTTFGEGYVSKYDSSGNLSWVRRMGSADSDQVNAVMAGATGNVFVAGSHNRNQVLPGGTADFPTGDILTGKGGFAMKLEQLPNGNPSVATITGIVFQDANGDGLNNDGSVAPTPLPKVYIDLNNNGARDSLEPTTTPYASGVYSININSLAIGTYHVRQELPPGWTVPILDTTDYVISVDSIADQLFVQKDFGSISSTPSTKFYVVNDSSTDQTFEYGDVGASIENYSLNIGNTAPRGAASTITGDKVWVVDANKKVYIYNTSGGLIGSWTAGSLASNATPEGITTNGTDIWIVDSKSDKVYKYAGAASITTGTVNATSSFSLSTSNSNPKDLVTDGNSIWVVNDNTTDKVFSYSLTGTLNWSWTIETPGTGSPTGITLDPSNVNRMWIVDNATDRVYQYDGAALGGFPGKLAASASFALSPGNTNPQGIADPPVANSLTDHILIELNDSVDAANIVSNGGIQIAESTWWTVPVFDNVNSTITRYQQLPGVISAIPDYVVELADHGLTTTEPNDGMLQGKCLWGLDNHTGEPGGNTCGFASGVNDADINALDAWNLMAGNNTAVVVAVIDTGVDYNHPDLAANIWTNTKEIAGNRKDDDGNGYVDDVRGWDFVNRDNDPMDTNGHGTHVSGTIGAVGNNNGAMMGIVGVAYNNVKIMPLRVFDSNGSGTTSSVIAAINYAVNNGAKISNNSYNIGGLQSVVASATLKGHLFIAAAGNAGTSAQQVPASYAPAQDSVISVAASTNFDAYASYSSWGSTVDLAAPGDAIWSTYPTKLDKFGDGSNDGYRRMSGTSMASPHVAGVAALVWAQNPSLSALDVKARILGTVDHPISLTGKTTVTNGRLNAFNALHSTIVASRALSGAGFTSASGNGSSITGQASTEILTFAITGTMSTSPAIQVVMGNPSYQPNEFEKTSVENRELLDSQESVQSEQTEITFISTPIWRPIAITADSKESTRLKHNDLTDIVFSDIVHWYPILRMLDR